jgi:DNA-directed RNA polymerase subunit RPC12/RpoP
MSESRQRPTGSIGHLFAVARGLEDEGRYNEAKFYRAAGFAELVRTTIEHPRAGHGLDAAMLASGLQLPDDTSQRVFICRRCGELFTGTPPKRCPGCRSGLLSFMEVLPIYYLEPLEPQVILEALAEMPSRMRETCGDVSEEAAWRGEWPLREICSHLLGAERLLIGRARRTVAEDDPEFRTVPPSEVKEEARSAFAELLDSFARQRASDLDWIRSLRYEDWGRTGRHPEWGRITLAVQLSYLARHEHSHLGDLERARTDSAQPAD